MASCSYCEKHLRKCIVSKENSSRCGECTRRGQKCDVRGPSSFDIASLLREQDRLDQEEEEATSKLLRLQKQKKFLRVRASEMIRRGLKTLDELDAVEESEQKECGAKQQLEREALASSSALVGGSSDFFLDPADPALAAALSAYDPSDPYWQGVGPGTPQTSQGS
ncbi:hypothetical protein LARI1_G009615 [Lachnellula arida]|uniref:Zn(2)-C6 fungal-type domain-containing protein n=1 Tax=Lachnellula arida TaxID=1316785 RepID=A0A8T9AYU1_9HELO|nr:hypothetical protein LARI1_G009615 [Lachnellula arida]